MGRNKLDRRVPVVQTVHGWGLNKTPAQEAMDVAILNLTDRVVAVSESDRRLMREKGVSNEIAVVYNGVAAPESGAGAGIAGERKPGGEIGVGTGVAAPESGAGAGITGEREPGGEIGVGTGEAAEIAGRLRAWRKDRVVIGCIGTIGKRKNQELLLRAAPRLRGEVRFVLIGEDPDNLIAGADAEVVTCLGYRPDVYRYLPLMDYAVFPSRSEGFSVALVESHMFSVPSIASDIPVFKEAVAEGETGFFFADDDPESLTDAIRRAVRLKRERTEAYAAMRRNCRRNYETRFTFERMMGQYETIYQRA
jgi:glycosyltransferase involved in cell wall biosynthesis